MNTDIELLTAWRTGDERSGKRLVVRHYAALERFFLNKARDDARDLIQRTFLVLLEARDKIQERGQGGQQDGQDVRRYLFGIARNLLLEHFRGVRRDGARLDFGTHSVEDLSPTPSTWLAEGRRSQSLLQALRRIPLELQVVLELYYWEELTAHELAQILGMPEGSVRTKIRRAKQLLERELSRLARSPQELRETLSDLDTWARQVREHLGAHAS